MAVDNVVEGLANHGLKALRYGKVERVPESLHGSTFDTLLEQHPLYKEVQFLTTTRENIKKELSSDQVLSREWEKFLLTSSYCARQQAEVCDDFELEGLHAAA